ncbi:MULTISPECIES: hypothetical protein [unclassified Rhizobacter]|uniref:hypothetical protein n=1 Tax=unclassified Rhizobacter TaxID=2640088 RepID=UPI0006F9A77C|nr:MULTISPECIES: hypothetical protein [unclassified Rhizobacter]KQU80943.1 hypothetical protein ASC88_15535 [Rhizobacter sp. Root29]KQW04486.1 hypothetical protein ASC98_05225 [Rhizobacter sp. Root1238]KRB06328.1 hypothetical protein ASE08_11780 [Rhizobacter sp. Root16D2]
MRIKEPTFPLTRNAFAAALRTGHGRARQQIDSYGTEGLEEEIIKACLSCLTYDPQCEAERAPWLFSIVEHAKLNAKVVQAIESTIQERPPEVHRDMDQRSAILKELAAAGSSDARRLLYSSLVRLSHTSDVIGAEQIVALDGVDGLIRVAGQLGRWLQDDPDFWVDDWLGAQFDAATGIEGGLATLEREAQVDPDVASYLAGMRRTRESQSASSSRFDVTAYTGAEIVAHVKKSPKDHCHWFKRWGAQAASEQRETVFAALLSSEEPELVKRLFRCFAKTGVPRFDSRLLRWLDHPDEQVQWAAVKAVAPTKHIELRQMAMRLIADGNMANGIALLVNNFEGSDFALCAEHLEQLDDPDEAHHLVGELLDLCEAHPGDDALDCLLYVYELSPCSACRRRAVRALTEMNTAPAWVLEEPMFDADPDTRALVSTDACRTEK